MPVSVLNLTQEPARSRLRALQDEFPLGSPPSGGYSQINRALREEELTPELAGLITNQLQLREEASRKVGDLAEHMLFTRSGLEQATRFRVALHHAHRYLRTGVPSVADLGCGLGIETLALATCGLQVTAVDIDSEIAGCAAYNLREFPDVEIKIGDINDVTPETLAAWNSASVFMDPARRSGKGRQFDPEKWAPPWSRVREIIDWGLPTGIKLAPGIAHELLPATCHTQWLAVGTELVEASLWTGQLAQEGPGRSAAVLTGGKFHVLEDPTMTAADAPVTPAPTGPLGQYVFEPNPSVIRSGLVAALARQTQTHLLHPKIAYLSGDEQIHSPFLAGFRVLETTAMRAKQIGAELRRLGAGPVEVKKRGVQVDTSALQKQLQRPRGRPLVVIATRVGDRHCALIAERITPDREAL